MKTITLNLLEDEHNNVPLLPIKIKNVNITIVALIDTGASMPVWVGPKEILLRLGAKYVNRHVPISGFGGGGTEGDLYEIPIFTVGELTFTWMSIVYIKDFFSRTDEKGNKIITDATYHIVLSATMFRNTIYEINDIDKLFKITVPNNALVRNVKIYSNDGKTYEILFNLLNNNGEAHKSYAAALKNHNDNTYGDTTPK